MDKLTVISGTLFFAADMFAIVSLAMPDWIITDVGGKETFVFVYLRHGLQVYKLIVILGDTRLGLMWSCMTLYNRPQICYKPDLKPEWWMALVCILVGCLLISTTIILLISSHWDRNAIPYARWVGFTASKIDFYSSQRLFWSYITNLYSLYFQWYCFVWQQSSFPWDST